MRKKPTTSGKRRQVRQGARQSLGVAHYKLSNGQRIAVRRKIAQLKAAESKTKYNEQRQEYAAQRAREREETRRLRELEAARESKGLVRDGRQDLAIRQRHVEMARERDLMELHTYKLQDMACDIAAGLGSKYGRGLDHLTQLELRKSLVEVGYAFGISKERVVRKILDAERRLGLLD